MACDMSLRLLYKYVSASFLPICNLHNEFKKRKGNELKLPHGNVGACVGECVVRVPKGPEHVGSDVQMKPAVDLGAASHTHPFHEVQT